MEPLFNSDPTVGIDVSSVVPSAAVIFLKNKVMLGLPWYRFTHPATAFCVAQLIDNRRTQVAMCHSDAFIPHSRNAIVDVFLRSSCEHLLMLDEDMLVPFGPSGAAWFNANTGWNLPSKFAGLNTIDRLLSHGVSLVGGLYFGRFPKANPVYGEGSHTAQREYALKAPYETGIQPTRWVGTGALLAHRSVFEDIEKKFPRLARGIDGKGGQFFSSSEHNAMDAIDRTRKMLSGGLMDGAKAMRAYEMLEAAAVDARTNSMLGIGEDVQLCTRAKAAGHQPYVDMGLLCGHLGTICYPIRA